MVAKVVVEKLVVAMITSIPSILIRSRSLPDSAKSTNSQHNHQYQVNTAQQGNAGHIPKAL